MSRLTKKGKAKSKGARKVLVLTSAAAVAMLAKQKSASAGTWVGSATDTLWGDANNWTSSNGPASGDTTDDLTFSGSYTIASNAGFTGNGSSTSNLLSQVNSINFASGANGPFTLTMASNAPLTIGSGGITTSSLFNAQLNQAIVVAPSTSTTFAVNSSGNLSFGSDTTVGSGATLNMALNGSTGTVSAYKTTVASGGTLLFSGTGAVGAINTVSLLGGTLQTQPGFKGTLSAYTNVVGTIVLGGSSNTIIGNGGTFSNHYFTGTINNLIIDTFSSTASMTLGGSGGHSSNASLQPGAVLTFGGTAGTTFLGKGSTGDGLTLAPGILAGSIIKQGTSTAFLTLHGTGSSSGITVTGGTLGMYEPIQPTDGYITNATVSSGGTLALAAAGTGTEFLGSGVGIFGSTANVLSLTGGALASSPQGNNNAKYFASTLEVDTTGTVTGPTAVTIGGPITGGGSLFTIDTTNGNGTGHVFAIANALPNSTSNTFSGTVKFLGASTGSSTNSSLVIGNSNSGVTVAIAGNLEIDGNLASNGVSLGAPNQIASTSTVTLNSGYFRLGTNSNLINTYIQNGGTLSGGSGILTATAASLTAGTITMTGGLVGNGAGSSMIVGGPGPVSVSSSPISGFATTTLTGGTLSLIGTSSLALSTLASSQLIVGDTAAHSAATLDLSGYSGATGYTLSSGQSLLGNGNVITGNTSKPLVVAAGAGLQPGDAPGVLTIGTSSANGNLNVAAQSTLTYDLSGVSANSDMANVLGQLNFGGSSSSTVNLDLNDVTLPATGHSATFELLAYGSYTGDLNSDITSDFSILINGSAPNPATTVVDVTNGVVGANQIDVTIASVPEPASLSLLGLGAVGLLGRRRRKSKKE